MNDLFFISKIEKKKIVNETFIIDFLYMVSVYANLIRVPDECKEKGVFLYADNAYCLLRNRMLLRIKVLKVLKA